jgi:transposase InsO family protein
MSRAGNVYDNAFMESCFGTFKTELEMTEYENHRAARSKIAEYIDYYCTDRKHSALGYLTPSEFERASMWSS